MDMLILRFDAPLMSFGGVMVDQHGPTERFPGLSLLTGLFGNAFGFRHSDAKALAELQSRIAYAARWDIAPEPLLDYHTVDLGQPKMCKHGWTTRGGPEHRAGGSAAYGTHQRYRHYWANGVMTLAVTLLGEDEPTVATLETALRSPARPLFLGRKTCLPAAHLLIGRTQAPDVLAGLHSVPRAERPGFKPKDNRMEACWPASIGVHDSARQLTVYDQRDWRNQVHTGQRVHIEGLLTGELP